jgi:hypothetical protein
MLSFLFLSANCFEISLDPKYTLAWRFVSEDQIEFTLSLQISEENGGFIGIGFLKRGLKHLH